MILIYDGFVGAFHYSGDSDIDPVLDPAMRAGQGKLFLVELKIRSHLLKPWLMTSDGIFQSLRQTVFQAAAAGKVVKVGVPEAAAK